MHAGVYAGNNESWVFTNTEPWLSTSQESPAFPEFLSRAY
jgi:hypothetical protein